MLLARCCCCLIDLICHLFLCWNRKQPAPVLFSMRKPRCKEDYIWCTPIVGTSSYSLLINVFYLMYFVNVSLLMSFPFSNTAHSLPKKSVSWFCKRIGHGKNERSCHQRIRAPRMHLSLLTSQSFGSFTIKRQQRFMLHSGFVRVSLNDSCTNTLNINTGTWDIRHCLTEAQTRQEASQMG